MNNMINSPISVETRKKTSIASCRHEIKAGEKFLAIHGEYRGHSSNKSLCKKCALKEMKKLLKEELMKIKELVKRS